MQSERDPEEGEKSGGSTREGSDRGEARLVKQKLRQEIAVDLQRLLDAPTNNLLAAIAEGTSPGELKRRVAAWIQAVTDCFALGIYVTVTKAEELEVAEGVTRARYLEKLKEEYLDPIRGGILYLLGGTVSEAAVYPSASAQPAGYGLRQPPTLQEAPVTLWISTLAPEPVELKRDICIVVQAKGEGYVATYFDAGISMSGDTQEEAVLNLKAVLVHVLEELEAESPEALAPQLAKQLAVLRGVMKHNTPSGG
jgi:predicted RNase H-like HicB family nuclease